MTVAKCRVEIYHRVGFFEDHFQRWTVSNGYKTDGDILELTSLYGDPDAQMALPTQLDTSVYWHCYVRCTVNDGGSKWRAYFQKLDNSWVYQEFTDTGRKYINLNTLCSGATIKTVRLWAEAPCDVEIDCEVITRDIIMLPMNSFDVIKTLRVKSPLLHRGIAGAQLTIANYNGVFNPYISEGDHIMIWLADNDADLGLPVAKVFGGIVAEFQNAAAKYGDFNMNLICHGYGYELDVPPDIVLKNYSAAPNGKTIIEEALTLCAYLVKGPVGKFFGCHTNCGISSTHDPLYDEEQPSTVIKEILDKAVNPVSVRGYDAYVHPAGYVLAHLRNSTDHNSPIASISPEGYVRARDVHPIRNYRLRVYSKLLSEYPEDEVWTEGAGVPATWTSDRTLSMNGDAQVGSYSLQAAGTLITTLWVQKAHDQIKASNGTIHFFHKSNYSTVDVVLKLYAPDASNYFYVSNVSVAGTWQEKTYAVGIENDALWNKVGNPQWNRVSALRLEYTWGAPVTVWVRIDDLQYTNVRLVGESEDATSQASHGQRSQKPIIDDALLSASEVQGRADELKDRFKDVFTTFQKVRVDGDNRYKPGDRQRIVVSNDNVDEYSRIVEVEHEVIGSEWDAILTLSNDPIEIDLVLKLLSDKQNLLKRSIQ